MKMIDMGMKNDMTAQPVEGKPENKIRYPSLYLDKAPSELMDKDIGQMCRLEIVVKIVGKTLIDNKDGKKENINLEIHKIGYVSDAGKKTKDEYLKMNEDEREEYNKEDVGIDEDDDEALGKKK